MALPAIGAGSRNVLYRNRGDGTFEDVTERAGLAHRESGRKPWSVSAGWFDYDNDGLLDLSVVNYCVWIPEKDPRNSGVKHKDNGRHFGTAKLG